MASIDIEVECDDCGGNLRITNVNGTTITVEPCESCLKVENDKGYDLGKEAYEGDLEGE